MVADRTLAQRWPDQVVERVGSKNFVLVVGAGISLNSANSAGEHPPTWAQLLERLAMRYSAGDSRKHVKALVSREQYLEAAELLRVLARKSGKEDDLLNRIAELTDGAGEAANRFQPATIHETLMNLEPDVIITTNYDKVLERASQNGYNVHSYASTTLGRDVRVGKPVLVKVHGSVDSATDLILTRSDYARLRAKGSHVLAVLEALLLTRTALFVGYGFNDPDIHLVLENVLGAQSDVPSHYLLTSKAIPQYRRDLYGYCYGTTIIGYKQGDYGEMARMLELLDERVQLERGLRL